jgi:hypothetical protein
MGRMYETRAFLCLEDDPSNGHDVGDDEEGKLGVHRAVGEEHRDVVHLQDPGRAWFRPALRCTTAGKPALLPIVASLQRTQVSPARMRNMVTKARSKAPNAAGARLPKADTPITASRGKKRSRGVGWGEGRGGAREK